MFKALAKFRFGMVRLLVPVFLGMVLACVSAGCSDQSDVRDTTIDSFRASIDVCLRGRGFGDDPGVVGLIPGGDPASEVPVVYEGYGIFTVAEEVGPPDLSDLWPKERKQRYWEALWGSGTEKGCVALAAHDVLGLSWEAAESVGPELAEFLELADRDPLVIAANAEGWSECMAEAGYDVADRRAIFGLFDLRREHMGMDGVEFGSVEWEEAAADEIAAKTADDACSQRGLEVLADVQWEYFWVYWEAVSDGRVPVPPRPTVPESAPTVTTTRAVSDSDYPCLSPYIHSDLASSVIPDEDLAVFESLSVSSAEELVGFESGEYLTWITSVGWAAGTCNNEVLRVLIDCGADLEAGYVPPLRQAVAAKNVEGAVMLLEGGADPNGTDHAGKVHSTGWTAVFDVVYFYETGGPEMLDILYEAGAALDVKDQYGGRPIELTMSPGRMELMGWFRDRGVFPSDDDYRWVVGEGQFDLLVALYDRGWLDLEDLQRRLDLVAIAREEGQDEIANWIEETVGQ